MDRLAKYLAAQPQGREPNVNTIMNELPGLTAKNIRAALANEQFKQRVKNIRQGPRNLNAHTMDQLREMAKANKIAVNANMTKNQLILAMRRRDPYNFLTIRQLKSRLKGAMYSRGQMKSEKQVANLLGGRNFKNLSRNNVYTRLKKLNQQPIVHQAKSKVSPQQKLLPLVVLPPKPLKFYLRNNNHNLTLNQLANLAIAGRSPPKYTGKVLSVYARKMAAASSSANDFKVMNPEMIPSYKYTPALYQQLVADAMMNQRGLIAVHSIGSGKTFTAIVAAQTLIKEGLVNKVIVITQLSIKDTFVDELRRHGLPPYSIYGYDEFISNCYNKETSLGDKGKKVTKYRLKAGIADMMKSSFVIIDEIHELRTAGGVKYNNILGVVSKAAKVLGLTATPIVNTPDDLRNEITLVSGIRMGDPVTHPADYGKYMSFYERDLHDPRYPKFTVHEVQIPMSQSYFERWVTEMPSLSHFHHLQRQNVLNNLDEGDDNTKYAWALSKVASIVNAGGKVILYSEFILKGLFRVMDHLDEMGIKYTSITGQTEVAERKVAQTKYNSGEAPVMLISKAGGQGIDLKKTTAVIIIEPPWNPAGVYQVIGRGVRVNSHIDLPKNLQHVDAYLLQSEPLEVTQQLSDKGMYDRFVWTKQEKIVDMYKLLTPYSIEGRRMHPEYPTRISVRAVASPIKRATNLSRLRNYMQNVNKHRSDILSAARNAAKKNPKFAVLLGKTVDNPTTDRLKMLLNASIKILGKN